MATFKVKHETIKFKTEAGEVSAIYPVIVSASRATDIPAFFSEWFINRVRAGWCEWVNPFNANQIQRVKFDKTRVFVFWSKNPRPLMQYLDELDQRGYHYYFQFSLNDYEAEKLEPGVPRKSERIATFLELADRYGPERVIWRYDPLLISPSLPADELLGRMLDLYQYLKGATRKLVISFADINAYSAVQKNLANLSQSFREPTLDEAKYLARGLMPLMQDTNGGLEIATCAEKWDLTQWGIGKNRCIDDELLRRIFKDDAKLQQFLGKSAMTSNVHQDLFGDHQPAQSVAFHKHPLRDPGQLSREECGCVLSKDIGAYNSCMHLCTYCYANSNRAAVKRTVERHDSQSPRLIPVRSDTP
jgi:hypothetical protein